MQFCVSRSSGYQKNEMISEQLSACSEHSFGRILPGILMQERGMTRAIAALLTLSALFSREPQPILFSRVAPTTMALYISQADGTQERPLLPPMGLDYDPAWSPDGQYIVFTSERNGSADLYRVRTDGTALERLTDSPAFDDQAGFSPDGKQIVFVTTRADGTADLWILDLRTRKLKPLTSGPGGDFRPAWSPDGKWIAFSSDRGFPPPMAKGRWEELHLVDIYIVHPDGSGLKRLTEHGEFCGSPQWMRDSRRLVAYCMPGQQTHAVRVGALTGVATRLLSIDIETLEVSEVDTGSGPRVKISPRVLPSGEIAYLGVGPTDQDFGLFYQSGKRGPIGYFPFLPSWSPDGTRIVYAKDLSTTNLTSGQAWTSVSEYKLIATGDLLMPAVHPSGDRFVAMNVDPSGGFGLTLVDMKTHDRREILKAAKGRTAAGPQWSAGGDFILFGLGAFNAVTSNEAGFTNDRSDGGAQVAMIKADGSDFRELTSGRNNNAYPSTSPDGKRFVYRTAGPEGRGLRIMNFETRAITTLTTDYDNFPLWSPRRDLILFVRMVENNYEIFTIRPDGTGQRRLTNSAGHNSHCAWSADGDWIVFTSSRKGFKDEAPYTLAPQPGGELFIMRYDGTQVRQLTDNKWEDGAPTWVPLSARVSMNR
jgi:Tol biopolymer transport system component